VTILGLATMDADATAVPPVDVTIARMYRETASNSRV
jgi:hypothetical protein